MKYRAEIDGLRGLAVVPVILFHAGFETFSGGFVGVDVFFVISGYLITTILLDEIEVKHFSLVNFYERRARRILPALFFVMFVSIPLAWMWMLPSQMNDFSKGLIAVSLFVSNVLFWRESGYFDANAEENPLLHTWSLAVEEQFYLLFPIFLILVWRFGKARVFWMIVVMALISLMLSEWGWRNRATANFYLAPTRAWELLTGSIAAIIVRKTGVQKNDFLAILGLAAILFSIFAYSAATPFPSLYTIVPIIGVVLVIIYASKETLVAKLLSTNIFVGIGLLSYSAYLWHQPLFAFSRILWLELHGISAAFLVFATLPLSYFSWRFIEKPFRNRATIGRRGIFIFSLLGALAFSMFGIFGIVTDGFKDRASWSDHYYSTLVPTELFNNNCLEAYPTFSSFSTCRASKPTPPTIALIGDSHSYPLYKALEARYPSEAIINIGKWSCLPFVNNEHLSKNNCEEHQNIIDSFLDSNQQIHTIILAGYWGYLSSGGFSYEGKGFRVHDEIISSDEASFLTNASRFLARHKLESRQILLIQDVPDLNFNPVQCGEMGVFRFVRSECRMGYGDFLPRKQQVDSLVSSLLSSDDDIIYIPTERLFCDELACSSMSDRGTLFMDSDHVSRLGAGLIVDQLENFINE